MYQYIHWCRKLTGHMGGGTIPMSLESAKEEVHYLNHDFPEITHWYETTPYNKAIQAELLPIGGNEGTKPTT